jgi:hypothetical protein
MAEMIAKQDGLNEVGTMSAMAAKRAELKNEGPQN